MSDSRKVHANRANTVINFKKAQSLIGRMQKMVEDDAYCVDIMQQNLAVIGLLKSAHQMLMEDHLHVCFETAMQSKVEGKKTIMVEEILKVTKLLK